MLKLMQRLACLSLLFAALLTSFGCALRPTLPADYRRSDFVAEIAWQWGELPLLARATGRGATDETDARLLSLELLEPPTLGGILLTEENGALTVTCHGVSADASFFTPLWQKAKALTRTGKLTPIAHTEEWGEPLLYAELRSEAEPWEFYLDPHSGAPRRIRNGDWELEIRSFTPTPNTQKG